METVFIKILNMSIAAGWTILFILAARLVLKKAPRWISCALWALAGLRLVWPFSFEASFSLIPSVNTIPSDIAVSTKPAIDSGISVINEAVNPVIAQSFAPSPVQSANPLQIVLPFLFWIWVSGVVVMLGYMAYSYGKLRRMVKASVRTGEGVMACDEVSSPFILGIFKPVIYVPSSLKGETLDLVLRHEKAHLKRGDHFWKPLGYLLLSVYWFHPLCWIAYILLCRDIESACDERVIRDMEKPMIAAYSEALVSCSVPSKLITVCPLAFGETGVKERIKGILNYKKPVFWIIIASLVVCAVLAVCLLSDPYGRGGRQVKSGIYTLKEELQGPYVYFNTEEQYWRCGGGIAYSFTMGGIYQIKGRTVEAWDQKNEELCLRFKILSEDEIRCDYVKEGFFANFPGWIEEGKTYVFWEPDDTELGQLKKRCPEYFGLPVENGITVLGWQMAQGNYQFGIMPGTGKSYEGKILQLHPLTLEQLQMVLAEYRGLGLKDSMIEVQPYTNPISSYAYAVDDAYRARLEEMVFGKTRELSYESVWVNYSSSQKDWPYCVNGNMLLFSDVPRHTLYRFDSKEQLDEFIAAAKDDLSLDHRYNGSASFNETITKYNGSFFKENSLLMAYVTAGSGSERFGITSIDYTADSLILHVRRINDPEVGTADMAGWMVMTGIPKTELEGRKLLDAYAW